jgi:hypothetical protein
MAIQARGRHVRELGSKLRGGQRPVTEEGLEDPQAHGMQEQFSARHDLATCYIEYGNVLKSEIHNVEDS